MRLSRKIEQAFGFVVAISLVIVFAVLAGLGVRNTFAESDGVSDTYLAEGAKFVTFYDDGAKLTVRTEAKTVQEALARAGVAINSGDTVEPSLDTEINADNFFINIYRARPVVVKDGKVIKYLMTASYDSRAIVETIEEEIPFTERTEKDPGLDKGVSEVRQLGEVGVKRVSYNILYIDNVEVSRELVSEEVIKAPVERVVAVGAKKSIPPEWETCASWARQAGVSEADLSAALDLIYHESGCRVDAANASGAYGIPQALPGSKMASIAADWETNPVTQIKWMIGYVNGRYGGWSQALNYWYTYGWY